MSEITGYRPPAAKPGTVKRVFQSLFARRRFDFGVKSATVQAQAIKKETAAARTEQLPAARIVPVEVTSLGQEFAIPYDEQSGSEPVTLVIGRNVTRLTTREALAAASNRDTLQLVVRKETIQVRKTGRGRVMWGDSSRALNVLPDEGVILPNTIDTMRNLIISMGDGTEIKAGSVGGSGNEIMLQTMRVVRLGK